jgi:aspartate racemase
MEYRMPPQEKIAGIIGGMGPEATVDLMRRVIRNTPAQDDIDHVHCLVDNNPKVPSRIRALVEGTGESPAPAMVDMARRLEKAGADFLCIACNTAHHYYPNVREAVHIPVLNMIALAVDAARKADPTARAFGILCTPATRTTKIYANILQEYGLEAVYPEPAVEAALLGVIKDVKKGNTGRDVKDRMAAIVRHMQDKGVVTAIAACTELGVIMEGEEYLISVLDAAEVLAQAIVQNAKNT